MKNRFTQAITTCLATYIGMLAQAKALAADSNGIATNDNSTNIFYQPWIWIGAIVVVAVILLGPHNVSSKEFVVIRKKPVKKGKV